MLDCDVNVSDDDVSLVNEATTNTHSIIIKSTTVDVTRKIARYT